MTDDYTLKFSYGDSYRIFKLTKSEYYRLQKFLELYEIGEETGSG